jgi:hypothetical protein
LLRWMVGVVPSVYGWLRGAYVGGWRIRWRMAHTLADGAYACRRGAYGRLWSAYACRRAHTLVEGCIRLRKGRIQQTVGRIRWRRGAYAW